MGTSGNYETIVFGIALVVVLKYARWPVELGRPLAAGGATRKATGQAHPAAARDKPATGERCWMCRRCASSSAGWWPSTT
jgi:branched-chain amino acid transport system permease protein